MQASPAYNSVIYHVPFTTVVTEAYFKVKLAHLSFKTDIHYFLTILSLCQKKYPYIGNNKNIQYNKTQVAYIFNSSHTCGTVKITADT